MPTFTQPIRTFRLAIFSLLALMLAISMVGGVSHSVEAAGKPPTATPTPTLAPTSAPTSTLSPAGTFYVDCSAATNGTGTQTSPWNNLTPVNTRNFAPGSSVLFKRGTTCSGSLQPQGSGSSASPNTLSSYGTGALPIIAGGTNEAAVKLNNQQYWNIQTLDVTGGMRFGILVSGDGTQVLHHIYITNVVVHDMAPGGTLDFKTTGLIVLGYNWLQEIDDILVDGVTVYNTTMWSGIITTGKNYKWQTTRNTGVIFRNSVAHHMYGDPIVAFSSENVVIENNVSYESGLQPPPQTIGSPNAIWTWDCSNCTVQFNESYTAHSPGADGGAFDIDYYSANTLVQYNYGHDLDAYCVSIFGYDGTTLNGTLRYNICANNAREATVDPDSQTDIWLAVWGKGKIEDTQVHNNTIYWNPTTTTDQYAISSGNLWAGCCFVGSNVIMNNIIYSTVPYLVSMSMNGNVSLNNNLYWYTGAGLPNFVWGNSKVSGLGAWQSKSGQDLNSIYANPLMNSPTYHGIGMPTTQFTLQAGSPAINAGADLVALGLAPSMGTRDFYGHTIPLGGAYDIGADEAQ
jgi:hypothetical protein